MSSRQVTRNIALTPHFDRLVKQKIASGRYQSASEVVRDALRLLEERDQDRKRQNSRLSRDIEIGWQQSERGELIDGPSVFEEIRALSATVRGKR
jgi:antitoxin ParD1/3/4